ncbi:MAG: DUF2318 domain-containing protein [Clostridiales Family XIII bacterium]|jgi:uncharacterized membrane protein|nr:DUF2318 domain-containing protein [Clostridiales Family XIII bacterium]
MKRNLTVFWGKRSSLIAVLVLTIVLLLAGCGGSGEGGSVTAAATPAGQDIVINVGDITETARFYPTEVDGTAVEILALRAPDGTIRTAFNTCQVCYGSGKGYYVQDGDVLVCQNCKNRFKASQVEVISGGCNPIPIMPENKVVTEETITIPAGYIKLAKDAFANWKL